MDTENLPGVAVVALGAGTPLGGPGWGEVAIDVAEAHTAVPVLSRHCPHADAADQG